MRSKTIKNLLIAKEIHVGCITLYQRRHSGAEWNWLADLTPKRARTAAKALTQAADEIDATKEQP